MRIVTSLLLFTSLLLSCNSLKNNRITVTGSAENAKTGAIVVDDADAHYYIDGLAAWDKNYYGKRITVKGYLRKVEHRQKSTVERKVQEISGTQLIILHSEWKLTE